MNLRELVGHGSPKMSGQRKDVRLSLGTGFEGTGNGRNEDMTSARLTSKVKERKRASE